MYDPDEIKVTAEGLMNEGIALRFSPPSESGYCCPGVRTRYQGQSIHYEFVRAPIGDNNVHVDVRAEDMKDGTCRVLFPYPGGRFEKGDRVELIDSKGRGRGSWGREGNRAGRLDQSRR
jgi:hypothetical protein